MKHIFFSIFFSITLLSSASLSAEIIIKNGDKIGFLGDSITHQGNTFSCGYINLVMSALKINGINAQKIPAGIGGNKAPQMLKRLDRDILKQKPQYMTLNTGVNDVYYGVSLDAYKKSITQIVEKAQAAGVKVYILTATMIHEDPMTQNNRKLIAYNDFLRQIAKEKNCVLVDLNTEMQKIVASVKKKYPQYKGKCTATFDGVHLSPIGHTMVARALLKAFGFTEEQIAKCDADWNKRMFHFRNLIYLTVHEYKQLSEIAYTAGTDVPTYIKRLIRNEIRK